MAKPAFKFDFRRKTATQAAPKALPMAAPPTTSAAIVPAQPATPQRFSFRNFGKRRRPANGSASIALQGAKSREIVRSDTRGGETLGGIFARSFKPGIGASVAGFLDESPVSKALEEATDGMINLSDVALLGGIVARGAELDGKVPLVGTHLRGMNTAFITGGIASKFYMAGRAGGRKLWGDNKGKAKAPTKKSDEMVPGEATQA